MAGDDVMKNCDTIELLKNVIQDDNCKRMNLSTIKGFYGELLVKKKLTLEGQEVEHLGNQSGYDLKVGDYKIDVKTSTLKNELGKYDILYWGWALMHENKNKPIACTHFVCVAVDSELIVSGYYIIPAINLQLFPKGTGQFARVKHGFQIVRNGHADKLPGEWPSAFKSSADLLNDKKAIRVGPNGSLYRALNVK
jgi:hypothetical protein